MLYTFLQLLHFFLWRINAVIIRTVQEQGLTGSDWPAYRRWRGSEIIWGWETFTLTEQSLIAEDLCRRIEIACTFGPLQGSNLGLQVRILTFQVFKIRLVDWILPTHILWSKVFNRAVESKTLTKNADDFMFWGIWQTWLRHFHRICRKNK